jgi:hypothetical protein
VCGGQERAAHIGTQFRRRHAGLGVGHLQREAHGREAEQLAAGLCSGRLRGRGERKQKPCITTIDSAATGPAIPAVSRRPRGADSSGSTRRDQGEHSLASEPLHRLAWRCRVRERSAHRCWRSSGRQWAISIDTDLQLFPHSAVGRGLNAAPGMGGRVTTRHRPGQVPAASGHGVEAQGSQTVSPDRPGQA